MVIGNCRAETRVVSRKCAMVTSRRRLVAGVLGTALARRSAPPTLASQSAGTEAPGRRPNIVLIVLDDLDSTVVTQLPEYQDLVADRGATFANFFVTTPLCAPSRASLLRGQYAHNHGLLTNTVPDGGFLAFHRLGREESTIATWLHDAGYRTALIGKYLNGFPRDVGQRYVPPGWDEWFGVTSKRALYYGFTLNENGTAVAYGDAPADYETDVLAAKAADFVKRSTGGDTPFFLYVAPLAPHAPATNAPRHAEEFTDVQFVRPPSYNEADIGDKPAWLRDVPLLTDDQVSQVDDNQRKRLRSLLSVLELLTGLMDVLRTHDALENTYILITSDNGWFAGEHRLGVGKQAVYEESIQVPLVVLGPGVLAGETIADLALNIDLAPTIAELAGVTPPDFVDGRSLVPLLRGEPPPIARQAALIELFAPADGEKTQPGVDEPVASGKAAKDVPPYRALRTAEAVYVEYDSGERELYDLRVDPYQLANLANNADPTLLIDGYSTRLAELARCAGETCQVAEDAPIEVFGIP
jgi:N-acetylglucosamine-6-sulfatase